MTLELPSWFAPAAFIVAVFSLPISCWWTFYLVRNSNQMNNSMFEAMKEAYGTSSKTLTDSANVTAEAAKAMMRSVDAANATTDKLAIFAAKMNPSDAWENLLRQSMFENSNGSARTRESEPMLPRHAVASPPAEEDDDETPPHVKRASDM